MPLTISPDLQSLIPPLSPEERDQLEANLLNDGCRDPLIAWREAGLLLDGHHRFAICEAHNLPYQIQEISLPDLDAARLWMIENQLGRRNLTPNQMSYYRGERYNLQKHRHGGDRKSDGSSTQNGNLKTVDRLAAEHGVSRDTIARDGIYAEALDTIATVLGPDVRSAIRDGDLPITKQDVPVLAARVQASPQVATQVAEALQEGHAAAAVHALLTVESPPPLVLEPEEVAVEAMPATTLSEREQAYFGPRTEKEPGSVAWCWQTIALMQSRWEQRTRDDAGVKALVDELRHYEAWNVVPPEEPYGSLEVLLSEELGLASVGDMLQEALWNLEHLEAHYRATPQLFELHQQGYLTLKDACLRFAALLDPAVPPEPAAVPEPEGAEAPPRRRDQVGTLKDAVFQTVQQLGPCTNAQVKAALGEERNVVHAALQALVKQGTITKEGKTYRVVDGA